MLGLTKAQVLAVARVVSVIHPGRSVCPRVGAVVHRFIRTIARAHLSYPVFEVEGKGIMTSTISSTNTAVSLPGLIASLHATVDAIGPADPSGESLDELAGAIEQLHIVGNKIEAAADGLLGGYDAAGGAQIAGHRTTADWLATTTGITLAGRGGGYTARALRDDLPETATALGRGQISLEHVRAIRGARRVLGEDYAGIEATVAGIAAQHTAADLRTILEVIIQQYRPEVHDDLAEHDQARRRVDLSPGLDNT